jgi:hypothetical protein
MKSRSIGVACLAVALAAASPAAHLAVAEDVETKKMLNLLCTERE